MRLIQRVGRIDRLGSRHAVVYAYNFVPDEHVERHLTLIGRLRAKLHAIDVSVGADRAVLATGEPPALPELQPASTRKGRRDPAERIADVLDADRYEQLRCWLRNHAADRDSSTPVLASLPGREQQRGVEVVLWIDGVIRAFRWSGESVVETDPFDVAAELIAASAERPARPTGCEVAAALQAVERQLAFASGQQPPSSAEPVRALETALSGIPGGPSAAQLARADAILTKIGLSPSGLNKEAYCATLDFDDLADRLEAVLSTVSQPALIAAVVRPIGSSAQSVAG